MDTNKKTRPLPDTATAFQNKHYVANLKQTYGLRKDLCELKHSIDDLKKQISIEYVRNKQQ